MKTLKTILPLFFVLIAALGARATILFQDSVNYPYVDGNIEGQGQWYCYTPKTPKLDAFVTNNVLFLQAISTNDSVATPTNGWSNPNPLIYVSFMLNVSQLPATTNGGYFAQLQTTNDYTDCAHIFIDTIGTTVPGTYRLGIGNIATSFSNVTPPVNYFQDLATNVWYTVVVAFGNSAASLNNQGAALLINPSVADYNNYNNGANFFDDPGYGYVFAEDSIPQTDTNVLDINITQIGFSPFITAGISNVLAGTTFPDVNSTGLPVFGIQPQSATGYSNNPAIFYAVASGSDVTYQWFSTTFGQLSDGAAYTGSQSDTLTVNNLTNTDTYYCVATDANGNHVTSSSATETVIITPTAPFFPISVVAEKLTNNLFTSTGFTNTALGTGPLYYQWYFAPTNLPTVFSALSGQTAPAINLNLADSSYQGSYYVVASNNLAGGSVAAGPTNTLVEIAPLVATMLQLHNLEISFTNQIKANPGGTIIINNNNVTVSGFVSWFRGYGSSYSEYFIQDATGLGCEVFFGGNGNTNTPPIGTYLTISAPLEVFESTLELSPASYASFVTNATPPGTVLTPRLDNAIFNDLNTNLFGANALTYGSSLVTFTNCYIYGSKTGGAFGTGGTHSGAGGIFLTNTFTQLYFTIGGPYNATPGPSQNTNTMEIFQIGSNFGTTPSPFAYQPIPTFCYQISGVYEDFDGFAELAPSRMEDYVTNATSAYSSGIVVSNRLATVTWTPHVGATYSVNGAANLSGQWTPLASGLAYYPTNGVFTDTNKVSTYKFYQVTSP
jgi:hypothetical protein